MTKYRPLSDRLAGHSDDEWRASFSDIEEVLGFPLPKSARSGRAWWANDGGKGHNLSWTSAGWHVGDVDPAASYVIFRRAEALGGAPAEPAPDSDPVQPEAMRKASEKAARASKFREAGPAAMVAGIALFAGVATLIARKALSRPAETPSA